MLLPDGGLTAHILIKIMGFLTTLLGGGNKNIPTFVQAVSAGYYTNGDTPAINTNNGNLLIAVVSCQTATSAMPVDTYGNTWIEIGTEQIETYYTYSARTQVFYAKNCIGGTNHGVTFIANYPSVALMEIAVASKTNPIDNHIQATTNGSPFLLNLTTRTKKNLIISVFNPYSSENPLTCADEGAIVRTFISSTSDYWGLCMSTRNAQSIGNYSSSWTSTNCNNGSMMKNISIRA